MTGLGDKTDDLKTSVNRMGFTINGNVWTIKESYSAINDGKEISNTFTVNEERKECIGPDGSKFKVCMIRPF